MSNNTCPACRHSFRSRHHSVQCGHKTLQQWHASKIGHNAHRGQYTPKRTASEILASQRSSADIMLTGSAAHPADPIQEDSHASN